MYMWSIFIRDQLSITVGGGGVATEWKTSVSEMFVPPPPPPPSRQGKTFRSPVPPPLFVLVVCPSCVRLFLQPPFFAETNFVAHPHPLPEINDRSPIFNISSSNESVFLVGD